MVVSKEIFSTQSFCDTYLGFCPITDGTQDELRDVLDESGHEELWDFPLDEVDHIVENNLNVVLVDTTYVNNDTHELISEYRWFEIPE